MNQSFNANLGITISAFEQGVNRALGLLGNLVTRVSQTSGTVTTLAANLNTRLTAAYSAADARQRVFDGGLGRLGDNLQKTGRNLSTYLTAPLLAAGVAAFKTYSDIDALKRGLQVIEGPAGNVNARFKELRQVAALPGLGLEEAVQGDIRLRAVGLSAKLSKEALLQFGNAIALTGGGKAELGSVTTQLAQMAAKGKVLAQDLKPVIEAAPAAAQVIKQLFGTIDSESISAKLEATGKTSTDFIELLTREMAKLDRISGGPKNAIENLGDALKIASYEFVGAADKSLNLTEKINSLGSFISNLANSFSNLSPTAQTAILSLIGIATAVGPVSLAIGTMIKYGPILFTTFTSGFGAMKTTALAVVSPIGILAGAIAVVGALAYSIHQFNVVADASINKSKLMAAVNKDVNAAIAQETGNLSSLLAVAQNEAVSKKARQNAIEQINAISPEYLGGLKLETINTVAATLAVAKYTQALTLKAKIQALSTRQAEAQIKADDAASKKPTDFAGGLSDEIGADFSSLKAFVSHDAAQKALQAKGLERQRAEIKRNTDEAAHYQQELIKAQTEASKLGINTPATTTPNFRDVGGDSLIKKLKDRQKALAEQIQSGNANGANTKGLQAEYDTLTAKIDAATASTKKHKAATAAGAEVNGLTVLESIYKRLGVEIEQYAIKGQTAPEALRRQWAALGVEIEAAHNALKRTNLDFVENKTVKTRIDSTAISNALTAAGGKSILPKGLGELVAEFQVKAKFDLLDDKADFEALKSQIAADFGVIKDTPEFDKVFATIIDRSTSGTPESIAKAAQIFQQGKISLGQAASGFFQSIGTAIGSGENPLQAAFSSILNLLGDYLIQLGESLLLSATFTAAAALFPSPLTPILAASGINQHLAGAGLILGGAAVKAFGGHKFAKGGVFDQPTFGLFGEYPGAGQVGNREIATPEKLMAGVFRNELQKTQPARAVPSLAGSGVGRIQVDVNGVLKGSDLHFAQTRYVEQYGDFTGNR